MSRQTFADILSLIARLRAPPSPAGAARVQMGGDERRGVPRWRFDRLPGTQSLISPCSGRLSERSWPYDCRNTRRMTVQLGFVLLSLCVRAVVFRQEW
jgi:hypothetical protein